MVNQKEKKIQVTITLDAGKSPSASKRQGGMKILGRDCLGRDSVPEEG